jgi:hypothetical protein
MKAWYFSNAEKILRYGDGREIAVGVTHTVDFPCTYGGSTYTKPALCEAGLHGSESILDALSYAPGPVVWRVELSGEMDADNDKVAATSRTYLAGGIDISDTLREFARWCALQVIDLWDAPAVVREYLETGCEDLQTAARDAARDDRDARDATYAARSAWAATDDADVSSRTARTAAYAAWAATYATRDTQEKKLTEMVESLIGKDE